MATMNTNEVSYNEAANTDEMEQFLICFGLKENNPIAFILPRYKFTEEFRRENNIGMFWRKYFYDPNQAREEVKEFVFSELVVIEE
jgi:hypothetical protein